MIDFKNEVSGFHSGQMDARLSLTRDGVELGYVDYSVYQDVPHISYIESFEKRAKVATLLLKKLQTMYPDVEINWGGMTDDGAALKKSMSFKKIPNEDVIAAKKRVEELKAREIELEGLLNSGTPVSEISDEWNALNDELRDLEDSLVHCQIRGVDDYTHIIEGSVKKTYWYHRTTIDRIESIRKYGLKINNENNLTGYATWIYKVCYECRPIFLSKSPNTQYVEHAPVVLKVDITGLPLVTDLPSLIEYGASFDESFMWFGEKDEIDDDDYLISDLLSPGSYDSKKFIRKTKTAACMIDIPVDRIIFPVNLQEKYVMPEPHIPDGFNIALMTLNEYMTFKNSKNKWHDEGLWNYTVADLNDEDKKRYNKDRYKHLLKTVKINGMYFKFKLDVEKKQYNHRTEDGENWLRDANNNMIPYTDDEIAQKGRQKYEYGIAVFDEDENMVARTSDEWGALLIAVTKEYQGFGLGPILAKLHAKFEPAKVSGGFTPAGYKNAIKAYREIIREALHSGLYRDLLNKKEITIERVKEIVKSAQLNIRPMPSQMDLSMSDTRDWLVYGEHGCFVLYDKKLKDFYHDAQWRERFVLGVILVRINKTRKGEVGIVVRFGGTTDKVKAFLLACVASFCADEKVPLMVDPDDMKYIDPSKYKVSKESDMNSGYERTKVVIENKLNLIMITHLDRLFRKQFDNYDEFKNSLVEIGYSKFDLTS